MSTKYLSLSRNELKTLDLQSIDYDTINSIYKYLYQTIIDVRKAGGYAEELFKEYMEKIRSDAETLVRLRLAKKALGAKTPSNSFDKQVVEGIDRVIEFITNYLVANYLVTPDMNIVVKALKDFIYNNRVWRTGDIGSMDLATAVFFYALGLVSPVKSIL